MKFVAKAQESRERDANMMMRGFVKIQTAKVLCLRLQCLERIRADVLKFTTGTEGQVNKMSDDLISRKALMEGRVENDPVRIADWMHVLRFWCSLRSRTESVSAYGDNPPKTLSGLYESTK